MKRMHIADETPGVMRVLSEKTKHLSAWMVGLGVVALVIAGCGTDRNPVSFHAPDQDWTAPDPTMLPDGMETVPPPAVASRSLSPLPSSAGPAHILVFGDHNSGGDLASLLRSLGHTVTVESALPPDLSTYNTIWHVGAFRALSSAEHARLAAFLASGGGLHLTGERPCSETMNASHTRFVNSVVVGGDVTIGGQGDIRSADGSYGYPYRVNPVAAGHVGAVPNAIRNLYLAAPGGIAGVSGANVLATGYNNVPIGAIWDSPQLAGRAGRLTVVMDANWFSSYCRRADDTRAIANIQEFLQGAAAGPIQVVIDIRPGSDENPINLKSNGVIPVAILTTGGFDATTVDGSTVVFAGAGPAHGGSHLEDVDGDGDIDWVGHFRTQDTDIVRGQTEAVLTGKTTNGKRIEGRDVIRTK